MSKYKQAPNLWNLSSIVLWCTMGTAKTRTKDGDLIPARPLGLDTIQNRLKLAWGVFTGKYDVLDWTVRDDPVRYIEKGLSKCP